MIKMIVEVTAKSQKDLDHVFDDICFRHNNEITQVKQSRMKRAKAQRNGKKGEYQP